MSIIYIHIYYLHTYLLLMYISVSYIDIKYLYTYLIFMEIYYIRDSNCVEEDGKHALTCDKCELGSSFSDNNPCFASSSSSLN